MSDLKEHNRKGPLEILAHRYWAGIGVIVTVLSLLLTAYLSSENSDYNDKNGNTASNDIPQKYETDARFTSSDSSMIENRITPESSTGDTENLANRILERCEMRNSLREATERTAHTLEDVRGDLLATLPEHRTSTMRERYRVATDELENLLNAIVGQNPECRSLVEPSK